MQIEIENPLDSTRVSVAWPNLREQFERLLEPARSEKAAIADARITAASAGDIVGAPIPQWAIDADADAQAAYDAWRSAGTNLLSRCTMHAQDGADRATILIEIRRICPYTDETAVLLCISRAVIDGRRVGPTPWADIGECECADGADYAMVRAAASLYRKIERYFA